MAEPLGLPFSCGACPALPPPPPFVRGEVDLPFRCLRRAAAHPRSAARSATTTRTTRRQAPRREQLCRRPLLRAAAAPYPAGRLGRGGGSGERGGERVSSRPLASVGTRFELSLFCLSAAFGDCVTSHWSSRVNTERTDNLADGDWPRARPHRPARGRAGYVENGWLCADSSG